MGLALLFMGIIFAIVGAVFGAAAGTVLALLIRVVRGNGRGRPPRRTRAPDEPAPRAARRPIRGGELFLLAILGGAATGGVLGLCFTYHVFFGQYPPPEGYPDWPAFRRSEMEYRAGRFDTLLPALAKYRAETGKYPADPDELVTRGHLPVLSGPRPDRRRTSGPVFESSARYHVSPDRDQFALSLRVTFHQGGFGREVQEEWVYTSDRPEWRPGEPPAEWSAKSLPSSTPPPKPVPNTDEDAKGK